MLRENVSKQAREIFDSMTSLHDIKDEKSTLGQALEEIVSPMPRNT